MKRCHMRLKNGGFFSGDGAGLLVGALSLSLPRMLSGVPVDVEEVTLASPDSTVSSECTSFSESDCCLDGSMMFSCTHNTRLRLKRKRIVFRGSLRHNVAMRTKWQLGLLVSVMTGAVLSMAWGMVAYAQQSSSTNYSVNEVFFGAGGDLSDCSTNYCSKLSVGETGVGNTTSSNYQAQGGFNTDRTPYLQFIVSSGSVDLGYLSTSQTKTATATFSVKTYLAGGYVVKADGNPPASTVAPFPQLHTLSSPTASSTGTEQFGMNLVANTSPTSFGQNPTQVPDSTFSFGTVASGYATPNFYKYVKGDIIASSTKSTGETDYTISYIFNIGSATPSGLYAFHQDLVATSTF